MRRVRGTEPWDPAALAAEGCWNRPRQSQPTRQTRTERIAARRREVRRRQVRTRLAVVVAVVIAAGAVTAKVVADRRGPQTLEAGLTPGSCRVDGSDRDSGPGRNHVASPTFRQSLPVPVAATAWHRRLLWDMAEVEKPPPHTATRARNACRTDHALPQIGGEA